MLPMKEPVAGSAKQTIRLGILWMAAAGFLLACYAYVRHTNADAGPTRQGQLGQEVRYGELSITVEDLGEGTVSGLSTITLDEHFVDARQSGGYESTVAKARESGKQLVSPASCLRFGVRYQWYNPDGSVRVAGQSGAARLRDSNGNEYKAVYLDDGAGRRGRIYCLDRCQLFADEEVQVSERNNAFSDRITDFLAFGLSPAGTQTLILSLDARGWGQRGKLEYVVHRSPQTDLAK